jgi:2-dehydropantoate 2-reductase
MNLKYLVIGTGGTGACIGGFLANTGKDVSFIARGKHLEAIEQKGLFILSPQMGKIHIKEPVISNINLYDEKADVIFVCVKCYSIDKLIPFIERASHENTVVIPITNVFGFATKISKKVPKVLSLGGCIYISSDISHYGEITMRSNIFRMIYGFRKHDLKRKEAHKWNGIINQITRDLNESGIEASVSDNIQREVFKKFSYVSPMSAVCAYLDANAGELQVQGEKRDIFITLMKEVIEVGKAMDIDLGDDIIEKNLGILESVLPNVTSSMQKDIEKGNESEIDGLIFAVVRMAKENGVSVPMYKKIAEKFNFYML